MSPSPKPSLRTLEQSGKAIPSARQLDPLTRSHVSPAPAPSANPYRVKLSMRHSANLCMSEILFLTVRRSGPRPFGCPRPGTAQRPGTRELPDSHSTGGYKRVFGCSLQEPLSLHAIDPFAQQSNEKPGVTLPERSMRKSLGGHPWTEAVPPLGSWSTTGTRLKVSYHDAGAP